MRWRTSPGRSWPRSARGLQAAGRQQRTRMRRGEQVCTHDLRPILRGHSGSASPVQSSTATPPTPNSPAPTRSAFFSLESNAATRASSSCTCCSVVFSRASEASSRAWMRFCGGAGQGRPAQIRPDGATLGREEIHHVLHQPGTGPPLQHTDTAYRPSKGCAACCPAGF